MNLKITIPINPIPKKNNSRIVKNGSFVRLLPSKRYIDYELLCKQYLPILKQPINQPINLKCTYYRVDKRKIDLCNLLESTCDMLVKHKILQDDNYTIVKSHDGSRVYYDKSNPRLEIEIDYAT